MLWRRLSSTLRTLPAADRADLVRAFVTLFVVRAGLRIGPLRRRLVAAAGADHACPVPPDPHLLRIFALAARAQPSSCLPRALALASFLRAHGTQTRLRLGVRRWPRREGHAWLEWDGGVLGSAPAHVAGFTPLLWAGRT